MTPPVPTSLLRFHFPGLRDQKLTTSFPGFSPTRRSVGWVGENPGNEVEKLTYSIQSGMLEEEPLNLQLDRFYLSNCHLFNYSRSPILKSECFSFTVDESDSNEHGQDLEQNNVANYESFTATDIKNASQDRWPFATTGMISCIIIKRW